MNKATLVLTVAMAWASGGALLGAEAEKATVEAFLILDTSPVPWGSRRWREIRAVAEAIIRELKPGDRLRIIAAHPSRARVLLMEEIRADELRRGEVIRVLDEIHSAAFVAADLRKALEVPLAAICDRVPGVGGGTFVGLLTDGVMSSRRAAGALAGVESLQKCGAYVVVTGLDNTSAAILRAAADGRIRWRALSQCEPARWLDETRRSCTGTRTAATVVGGGPEPMARESCRTAPVSILVDGQPPVPEKSAGEAMPVRGDESAHVKAPQGKQLGTPGTKKAPLTAQAIRAASRAEGQSDGKTALPPPTVGKQNPVPTVPPLVSRLWQGLAPGWRRVILAVGIVAAPCLGFLIWDALRVLRQRAARRRDLARRESVAMRLVAVANGKEHILGPTELVRRFRVGSAAGNAVVVAGDGVDPHHIDIRRKGPRWWVCNLSEKAVEINGSPLPGRKKRDISFPALIGLNGKASLRLFLRAAESAAPSGTLPTEV